MTVRSTLVSDCKVGDHFKRPEWPWKDRQNYKVFHDLLEMELKFSQNCNISCDWMTSFSISAIFTQYLLIFGTVNLPGNWDSWCCSHVCWWRTFQENVTPTSKLIFKCKPAECRLSGRERWLLTLWNTCGWDVNGEA